MRLAAEIVILILGMIAILALLPAAPRRRPGMRALSRVRRPDDLMGLEQIVVTGRSNAGEVHARLRPVVREIASARLARHGVQLERDGERARTLLGDATWELVRPDRPKPTDRHEPGVSLTELEEIVDRLERL